MSLSQAANIVSYRELGLRWKKDPVLSGNREMNIVEFSKLGKKDNSMKGLI